MFTTDVATDHGITKGMLRYALLNGRIERLGHGVYAFAGAPRTTQFGLAQAVALGGRWATVTHRAAAAIWDLPGGDRSIVEISVPRWRRPHPASWIIHESTDLTPADRTVVDGLPVTTATRTLIDLGTRIPTWQVDQAVNHAIRAGLTTLEHLAERRRTLSRRGRNGVGVMREVIERRVEGSERAESMLEARVWRVLRDGGLPPPVLQLVVWDGGSPVARLDGAYPTIKVGIEVDGYQFHGDPAAQSRDRARRNLVESIGWAIVNVDATQLRDAPDAFVARIDRLCTTRARQLGVPFP